MGSQYKGVKLKYEIIVTMLSNLINVCADNNFVVVVDQISTLVNENPVSYTHLVQVVISELFNNLSLIHI